MRKLLLLLLLLIPHEAWSACTPTSDYTCVTCIYSEAGDCRQPTALLPTQVQNTINASVNGDGVYLPADTQTWTSGVSFSNKQINIIGQGDDQTIINRDCTTPNNCAHSIFDVGHSEMNWKSVRISSMRINCIDGAGTYGIQLWGSVQTYPSNLFRIDHMKFVDSDGCQNDPGADDRAIIIWNGSLAGSMNYGLIDSNTFNTSAVNNRYTQNILIEANQETSTGPPGTPDWLRASTLGEYKSIFIENNTFIGPANSTNDPNDWTIDCDRGGRVVFRYNNVQNMVTAVHGFDVSGSSSCAITTAARGCRQIEVYNNAIDMESPIAGNKNAGIVIRGGEGVIFNNSITGDFDDSIRLEVYRANEGITYACNHCGDGDPPYVDGNELAGGWRCRDTFGTGQDTGVWGVAAPGASAGYLWGNKFCSDSHTPSSCSTTTTAYTEYPTRMIKYNAITDPDNYSYVEETVKPSYTAYPCPHPLTGLVGKCDTAWKGLYTGHIGNVFIGASAGTMTTGTGGTISW